MSENKNNDSNNIINIDKNPPNKIESGIWFLSNYRDPSNINLPRRVNHATATNGTKIYILGGYHKLDKRLNFDVSEFEDNTYHTLDCHEFDCLTQTCIERKSIEKTHIHQETLPILRYGLRACCLNNKLYIYGGILDFDNENLNYDQLVSHFQDVFELDLVTWQFSNLSLKSRIVSTLRFQNYCEFTLSERVSIMETLSKSPGVRDGHSLIAVPKLNSFIIFGGWEHDENLLGDLWLFDIDAANNEQTDKLINGQLFPDWLQLKVRGEIGKARPQSDEEISLPFPRDFSDLQLIGDDLILYGGRTYDYDIYNNKWVEVYDPEIWIIKGLFAFDKPHQVARNAPEFTWQRLCTQKQSPEKPLVLIPPARRSQMTFIRNGDFYVIGGVDGNNHHQPDLWKFSMAEKNWSLVKIYFNKILKNESNPNSSQPELPRSRRRGSLLFLENLDWLAMVCGTRQATSEEVDFLKLKETSLNLENEAGERLIEVDDFNIFAFNHSLKNIAIKDVLDSISIKDYNFYDELKKSSNLNSKRAIETVKSLDDYPARDTFNKICYLTAACRRNEKQENTITLRRKSTTTTKG